MEIIDMGGRGKEERERRIYRDRQK